MNLRPIKAFAPRTAGERFILAYLCAYTNHKGCNANVPEGEVVNDCIRAATGAIPFWGRLPVVALWFYYAMQRAGNREYFMRIKKAIRSNKLYWCSVDSKF